VDLAGYADMSSEHGRKQRSWMERLGMQAAFEQQMAKMRVAPRPS